MSIDALRNDPAFWHAADVAGEDWTMPLSAAQADELAGAVAAMTRDRVRPGAVGPARYPLPALAALLQRTREALSRGRGFVLLRGLPVDRWSVREAELAFLLLGAHLGTVLTQNRAAELIVHIRDKGPKRSPFERGYATAAESKFHIDLTDVVGLLCIRQAASGGQSRISSALAVLDAAMRERPDLMPILLRGFPWDRRDEHGEGDEPVGPPIPVFSQASGSWTCRYNRGFILAAFQRRGIEPSAPELAALDFFDEAAQRRKHVLEMEFRPGDVQLLSNATVLHGRSAFVDGGDIGHQRLLLRLWLALEGFRAYANPAVVRDALVRYGNLGLPASDPRARMPEEID